MTKRDFPRMTRGHFEAIARTLREERPDRDGTRWADGARDEWSTTVLAFASLCHDSSNLTPNGNRAFDRERFLRACGYLGDGADAGA